MKKLYFLFTLLLLLFSGYSQEAADANPDLDLAAEYTPPREADVRAHLDQWQALKFGMIIHWGLYAVPGIVESWSICSEDEDWIPRDSTMDYNAYKQWYWNLNKEFNPRQFDPDQWAASAKKAGMKYVVFTTKHHDGFAMYDTKYSDYSVAKGLFADHPKADVAKYVFEAFRNQNMMIGAYFSKPDWHSQDYWWSRYATPDRHVNYTIDNHPQRWNDFKQFVYNQIDEITSSYGKIDILWLDGGWVRAPKEDIGMDNIARMARRNQPGLIIVDRTVTGEYENYRTPEKMIPEKQLPYPWETCMPLSKDWGFVPGAIFKSPDVIISTLIEVVAKGGSLLLGVGPTPEGVIEPEVVRILDEIGQWLKANGEAIYNTRNTPIYHDGNVWFTVSKDKLTTYAIVRPDGPVPATVSWHGNLPAKGSKMILLADKSVVKYKISGDSVIITVPKSMRAKGKPFAIAFQTAANGFSYNDLNHNGRCDPYENPNLTVNERVEDLLSKMTLEEKAGQLVMTMGWEYYEKTGNQYVLTEKFKKELREKHLGSTWAVMRADPWTQKTLQNGLTPEAAHNLTNEMQLWNRKNTRLGIPLIFAEEAPHGHMAIGTTVLPTAIGRASTFNKKLENILGWCVGSEIWAQGAQIAFGPVLDIVRDPRWSRVEETYGEDPVLTGLMGGAYASGLQGYGLISTLKHFTAHGISEGGHNGNSAQVGERELLSVLSYPFQKALWLGGAQSVMTAYNDVDGIPCSGNKWLLRDVLRHEWGFKGLVISDLYAINGLVSARMAADYSEAAALAVKVGVDIDLGGSCYGEQLVRAVKNGLVTEAQIDELVKHVLTQKFQLGLFDATFDKPYVAFDMALHETQNLKVAQESVILLKNDNETLPLSKTVKKVAVIGPNADNVYNMLGDYTAPQADGSVITVLQGIREKLPNAQVEYVKGCHIRDTSLNEIARAVRAAEGADVVVAVLGGSSARDFRTNYKETGAAEVTGPAISDMDAGEGFDRATLQMLGRQEELLKVLCATGKPVVLVMIQGRPLDLSWADANVPAILNAWYPGSQGGRAIADIIFGDVNPSGKLPISYPRSVGQLPVYYNATEVRRDYTDAPASPLYPFGYGLSYTTFEYSNMQSIWKNDTTLEVSCQLTNTGNYDGAEAVQLYMRHNQASVKMPERQLKAFEKVFLKKGETKTVTMTLSKSDFAILNEDLQWVVEPGKVTLMLGSSSRDIRLQGDVRVGRY
jgi:beta-glucosidase